MSDILRSFYDDVLNSKIASLRFQSSHDYFFKVNNKNNAMRLCTYRYYETL